jgi:hypothetical protein
MRILCPHCNRPAKIRTSRAITPLTREAYVQCENVACCHVFRVIVSAVATIVPPLAPNPSVFLPAHTKNDPEPRQRSLL